MYLTRKEAAYFADRAYGINRQVLFVSEPKNLGLITMPYIAVINGAGAAFEYNILGGCNVLVAIPGVYAN